MLIIDRLIIASVRFVLDKVASSVEAELNDDTTLRETLLEAQMRVELGEMSQEEFNELEDVILVRLREIQERKQGGKRTPIEFSTRSEGADGEGHEEGAEDGEDGGPGEFRVTGIEATFGGDERDQADREEQDENEK